LLIQENIKVKQTIKHVLSSPAAWLFAAVWLASLVYLLLTGNGVIGSAAFALGILVFAAITVSMTEDQPYIPDLEKRPPPVPWLQILVILFFILLTGYRGFVFNTQPGDPLKSPSGLFLVIGLQTWAGAIYLILWIIHPGLPPLISPAIF
jgi:formate-dependent nitrite reductase membrane component NrfD